MTSRRGQFTSFQSTLPTRGSDGRCSLYPPTRGGFQSTLPTRGSDEVYRRRQTAACGFNPRSPRGGATIFAIAYLPIMAVSIHAPHEGERLSTSTFILAPSMFQSTLPTRGSDYSPVATPYEAAVFQSTLPTRGSDPVGCFGCPFGEKFQSTLPTRGSDPKSCFGMCMFRFCFNPRSPRGGATSRTDIKKLWYWMFQSTLPTRGSDAPKRPTSSFAVPFQSTLPTRGSDWINFAIYCNTLRFNPRSPRGGATCSYS